MKNIFLPILIVTTIFCTARAHATTAATSIPTVWYEPTTAAVGDQIQLHATIENPTAQSATMTVSFFVNKGVVATAPATVVAAHGSSSVSASWLMPEIKTAVTAAVTNATSSKKEVFALERVVGTITIGGTTGIAIPGKGLVAQGARGIYQLCEEYRVRQVAYFDDLKAKEKNALKQMALAHLDTLIHPAQHPGESTHASLMPYLLYAYATAGDAFFAKPAIYYTALIVAILLIIRFIFNRLV